MNRKSWKCTSEVLSPYGFLDDSLEVWSVDRRELVNA